MGQQGDLEHLGTVPFFIPPVFPQAMVAKIGAGIRSHSDSAWAIFFFFSVERLCSTQTSHHLKRGGFQELPDQIIPQNDPFWEWWKKFNSLVGNLNLQVLSGNRRKEFTSRRKFTCFSGFHVRFGVGGFWWYFSLRNRGPRYPKLEELGGSYHEGGDRKSRWCLNSGRSPRNVDDARLFLETFTQNPLMISVGMF